MKKCPFCKKTTYDSGHLTGFGYPAEWVSFEKFQDCIGEECIAFYRKEVYSNYEGKYITVDKCSLCERQKHEQIFSDDFMLKLP